MQEAEIGGGGTREALMRGTLVWAWSVGRCLQRAWGLLSALLGSRVSVQVSYLKYEGDLGINLTRFHDNNK